MSKERIQKVLAQNGYSSRRKIENLIREGRVFINEVPAKLGDRISKEEKIFIDGKKLNFSKAIKGSTNYAHFKFKDDSTIESIRD